MWFWIIIFCSFLFIPLLMIILGKIMFLNPPKKINYIFGYRTYLSMKNKDTWVFAHKTCGKLWWKIGWIMFFVSAASCFPFINSDRKTIGIFVSVLCIIQCFVLIGSIFPVERALKRNFNSDGSRK